MAVELIDHVSKNISHWVYGLKMANEKEMKEKDVSELRMKVIYFLNHKNDLKVEKTTYKCSFLLRKYTIGIKIEDKN